jgi:hypothetical protein
MRYILDDSGYIHSVSCTPFNCADKSCQEYTGAIPSGYETLAEWAQNANIRAYKLVGGNLTFDAAKDAELTAEWAKCVGIDTMTIALSGNTDHKVSTAWTYNKILCDTVKTDIGNKLKFENNSIKIGSGVKYVRVNANIMTSGIANHQIAGITHNGESVSRGYYRATNASYYGVIALTPIILEVAEDDTIALEYGAATTGTMTISGGNYTYLTVEAIGGVI